MTRIPAQFVVGSFFMALLLGVLPPPSSGFVVVPSSPRPTQVAQPQQLLLKLGPNGASVTTMKSRGHVMQRMSNRNDENVSSNNPLDFLLHPYQSKIPKEIEAEIYEAEGNTAAAKDRGKRIALYAAIAVVGVLAAFFNAFLSELRSSTPLEGEIPFELATSPFAWVQDNFLWQFFFLNKIGGGLLLLLGAGAGLLAESEFDSRRINAERIWEELQLRRDKAAQKKDNAAQRKKGKQKSSLGKKQTKRLAALSEVVVEAGTAPVPPGIPVELEASVSNVPTTNANADAREGAAKKEEGGGLFKGIKDMYEKADTLAASQALLLNKKLEDAGVLEKITDETGLKVIGKEAGSKLQSQDSDASKNDP